MRIPTAMALGLALAAVLAGCNPESDTSSAGQGLKAVVTDQTLDSALAAAKQDGKPVIAVFSAPSWCHWCIKLDEETLSDAKVQERLKAFHVVFVDFDKEKKLDKEYRISGVPTLIFFDSSGKKVHETGFVEARQFLQEIDKAFPSSGAA